MSVRIGGLASGGYSAFECLPSGDIVHGGLMTAYEDKGSMGLPAQVWVPLEEVPAGKILRNGVVEYERRDSGGLVGTRFKMFYFAGDSRPGVDDVWGSFLFGQQIMGDGSWRVIDNVGELYGICLLAMFNALASGRVFTRAMTDEDTRWLITEMDECASPDQFRQVVMFVERAAAERLLIEVPS